MSERRAGASSGRRASVRVRLLAIALLPTLVVLPLLLGVAMLRWNAKFDGLLISKVSGDLTIARQYLRRILENTGDHIQALGASAQFRDIVGAQAPGRLAGWLEDGRRDLGLDFLLVLGPDGAIAAAAPAESRRTPARTDWPVIAAALQGRSSTAIDILTTEELSDLSPALPSRARLELVSTAAAAPTQRTAETRGMIVHSASPVALGDGRRGALVGGILLNQNLEFIDTINDLVYGQASLPEGSQGTATLFLDDVRISTNVRLFEGRRALGTRVSNAVRSAVLEHGRVWRDSAFVVNDWYVSGYEPITDSFGKRVGMLYVGFLEAPFRQTKYVTAAAVIGAFLVVTLISVPIFLRWARGIFRPLERMTETIGQVEAGDLGARTRLAGARDEIGLVAQHLDALLDRLQERERQLRDWNEELNRRVAERTRDLETANRQLETTTQQLVMSEKLAAIGEITAGIAHEINNPIAVMQGNLEVVRQVVGDSAALAATEFRLIDEQIARIADIVTRVLQFARPEEYAGYVELQKPAEVITDTLPLVQHLLGKAAIAVVREDHAAARVLMNRTELQQVLVNLIVNAIHAMPEGGTLTLRTEDRSHEERPGIAIEIADTGIGMTPDVLGRIFDPFYTTKRQDGTGLGLSISQRLILRQGGTISAESEPGRGTTFSIWLPDARDADILS